MKYYVAIDKNRVVKGYGTSFTSVEGCETILLENGSERIFDEYDKVFILNSKDEIEAISEELELPSLKKQKEFELAEQCESSIRSGVEYNGYIFSLDDEAQNNFITAKQLIDSNQDAIFENIVWTAKKDGEYVRVKLTKEDINNITGTIFKHKMSNISKLRDFLIPLVKEATSKEELDAIVW